MPPPPDIHIGDASDDELDAPRARLAGGSRQSRLNESNFEVTRTWDQLQEGADGTITGAVEGLREANKRKR